MSKAKMDLVIAMARSHRALFDLIDKNVRSYGFTVSEFGVLELLMHKGPRAVQQIAEEILVTSGTMTYVIDKLERDGWVVRRQNPDDRRIFIVELTESGNRRIKDIFPEHKRYLNKIFHGLDDRKLKELLSGLIELKNHISYF